MLNLAVLNLAVLNLAVLNLAVLNLAVLNLAVLNRVRSSVRSAWPPRRLGQSSSVAHWSLTARVQLLSSARDALQLHPAMGGRVVLGVVLGGGFIAASTGCASPTTKEVASLERPPTPPASRDTGRPAAPSSPSTPAATGLRLRAASACEIGTERGVVIDQGSCDTHALWSYTIPFSSKLPTSCQISQDSARLVLACPLADSPKSQVHSYDPDGDWLWTQSVPVQEINELSQLASGQIVVAGHNSKNGEIAAQLWVLSDAGDVVQSHDLSDWGTRVQLTDLSVHSDSVLLAGTCTGACKLPHKDGKTETAVFLARLGADHLWVDLAVQVDAPGVASLVAHAGPGTAYFGMVMLEEAKLHERTFRRVGKKVNCLPDITLRSSGRSQIFATRPLIVQLTKNGDAWNVTQTTQLPSPGASLDGLMGDPTGGVFLGGRFLEQIEFEGRVLKTVPTKDIYDAKPCPQEPNIASYYLHLNKGPARSWTEASAIAGFVGVSGDTLIATSNGNAWPFSDGPSELLAWRDSKLVWKKLATPGRILDAELAPGGAVIAVFLHRRHLQLTSYDLRPKDPIPWAPALQR